MRTVRTLALVVITSLLVMLGHCPVNADTAGRPLLKGCVSLKEVAATPTYMLRPALEKRWGVVGLGVKATPPLDGYDYPECGGWIIERTVTVFFDHEHRVLLFVYMSNEGVKTHRTVNRPWPTRCVTYREIAHTPRYSTRLALEKRWGVVGLGVKAMSPYQEYRYPQCGGWLKPHQVTVIFDRLPHRLMLSWVHRNP